MWGGPPRAGTPSRERPTPSGRRIGQGRLSPGRRPSPPATRMRCALRSHPRAPIVHPSRRPVTAVPAGTTGRSPPEPPCRFATSPAWARGRRAGHARGNLGRHAGHCAGAPGQRSRPPQALAGSGWRRDLGVEPAGGPQCTRKGRRSWTRAVRWQQRFAQGGENLSI